MVTLDRRDRLRSATVPCDRILPLAPAWQLADGLYLHRVDACISRTESPAGACEWRRICKNPGELTCPRGDHLIDVGPGVQRGRCRSLAESFGRICVIKSRSPGNSFRDGALLLRICSPALKAVPGWIMTGCRNESDCACKIWITRSSAAQRAGETHAEER